MKITIVYDNESTREDLQADWGFACVIEVNGRKILFDTGAKGEILLANMAKLGVDVETIDEIFISHYHWDHTGGLEALLRIRPFDLYLPPSYKAPEGAGKVTYLEKPTTIRESFYSTGELEGVEQSLVIDTQNGVVVIAGCSHPGVKKILQAASHFGTPVALIGGLHGFAEYEALEGLKLICATHCTEHKKEIKERFPKAYVEGGVGEVIEID